MKPAKKDLQDFVARFGDQSNVIRIGRKASELIGIGTEYLVVNGNVICKFQDGNIVANTLRLPVDDQAETCA